MPRPGHSTCQFLLIPELLYADAIDATSGRCHFDPPWHHSVAVSSTCLPRSRLQRRGGNGGGNGGLEAPASPSGLQATSQDGAIGLEWDAVGEADTYRVYRSTSSGVDVSGSPLNTEMSSADYVDESAENGTKYYYVVTAVASEGGDSAESDPSGEVEATPFSDPPDRP